MIIPKIYLSKSKAGNPDHIRMVKDYLANYHCEILEAPSGEYNFNNLEMADHFLLIPPLLENKVDEEVLVGKGQYLEFDHYMNLDLNIYQQTLSGGYTACILQAISEAQLIVHETDNSTVIAKDWKLNYAELLISLEPITDIAKLFGLELKNPVIIVKEPKKGFFNW